MKLNAISRLAAGLVIGLVMTGVAHAADTPESLDGAKLVSAEDVAKLRTSGVMIVDTRVAAEYAEGHIKGAVNIPYREKSAKAADFDASQDEFNLSKLPSDKAAPVVIYCNGPECWKSFKGSKAVIKAGYTNVHWYRLGFPEWKSKGQPSESAD
jgi:rhodanese-related sulfurtransferase